MKYLSVQETAEKWGISLRSVRNYCAQGRVWGAILKGKTWYIPEIADKPKRAEQRKLLGTLLEEKEKGITGGIYHEVQIELTYNSNHIEGSKLSHDQTRYIFETSTVGFEAEALPLDDIVETANHFRAVDLILENVMKPLSERFIKELHFVLKNGTSDSRKSWFNVGEYKKYPNQVGGKETTPPEEVSKKIKELIIKYNSAKDKTLDDLLDFHYVFESIHPFQDGNGRIGRLLLFKECLRHNIVPFIIDEKLKYFYYRGLNEWKHERGYLRDTCLAAQDKFRERMKYYRVK